MYADMDANDNLGTQPRTKQMQRIKRALLYITIITMISVFRAKNLTRAVEVFCLFFLLCYLPTLIVLLVNSNFNRKLTRFTRDSND